MLSCTRFNTGSAYNIVPETAAIAGTVRYFDPEVMALVDTRMRELCAGLAVAHGIEIDVDIRNVFDVLVNDPDLADACRRRRRHSGPRERERRRPAGHGFRGFRRHVRHGARRLYQRHAWRPGRPAQSRLRAGTWVLPIGASIYARIIERRMPLLKEAA